MDNEEIKEARHKLGLKVEDMAAMLETDQNSLRKIEMNPERSTARKPPPRFVRLLRAYLAGYRPDDWPKK